MLSTIIYRSHIADHVPLKMLEGLVTKANKINESSSVTGILLFNGTHFFRCLKDLKRMSWQFMSVFAAIPAIIILWN